MELADEIRVKADKATVFAMLNDPEVLKNNPGGCLSRESLLEPIVRLLPMDVGVRSCESDGR